MTALSDVRIAAEAYRCLPPLKVAAAAHLCAIPSIRNHALRNFAARGLAQQG